MITRDSSLLIDPSLALAQARSVLQIEADALLELQQRLNHDFVAAAQLILQGAGRVVVSGIGKSGHIARKVAATFASTGTPAFFVHPAEANHGDLGMITAEDVLLSFSYSGETQELVTIMPLIKRLGTRSIAITGNAQSSLAKLADVHLLAAVSKEACPLNLAPTASTTAALALGDALAVVLLEARGFGSDDFARSHPGGALGRRLLTHVRDVMRSGAQVPCVQADALLPTAILEITAKRMGMTAVADPAGRVIGIFTDGDLRRALAQHRDIQQLQVAQVMTPNPRTISPQQLAVEAVKTMEEFKVNQLLVLEHEQLVGALNMHDLFAAKVI